MKCKSGRKIDNQLPETPALKSSRKFRAKCAARLEEFEVLKEETLPKLYAAILDLEAGGNVLQTVQQIKSLLIPHLGELAQTQNLHQHPGSAGHAIDPRMYLSGVDQFRSSEDAASIPNSPLYMNRTNGGTLHEGMMLDNPTQNESSGDHVVWENSESDDCRRMWGPHFGRYI